MPRTNPDIARSSALCRYFSAPKARNAIRPKPTLAMIMPETAAREISGVMMETLFSLCSDPHQPIPEKSDDIGKSVGVGCKNADSPDPCEDRHKLVGRSTKGPRILFHFWKTKK